MDRDAVRTKLQDILRDVVDDDSVVITDEAIAGDIAHWDSTNHVRLIVALEQELHIHFETDEITAPKSVGALIELIQAKLTG